MKSSLAEPLIHLDRFKHKIVSFCLTDVSENGSVVSMKCISNPQISGDCRAFVSAEALFSSRFMIVAGSWQELV